jgi:putative monooxygenase ydhR
MAGKILQVNFKFNVPRVDYEQAANSLAPQFAQVPGLLWKVWTINEAESEAGGVYYFEDEPSLQTYLAGPLAAAVNDHPALSEMSVKQFEVMPDVTAVTRGPV